MKLLSFLILNLIIIGMILTVFFYPGYEWYLSCILYILYVLIILELCVLSIACEE